MSSPALSFGLETLVEDTPGLTLHAATSTLDQALASCADAGECVALIDLQLCTLEMEALLRLFRDAAPRTHVVLLCDGCPPHTLREAVRHGAIGFLDKIADAREIRAAISAAGRGQRYLGASVTADLAASLTLQALTAREMDVLRLLARGSCNKTVARDLGVTVGTVKTHVRSIMAKLESRSRTDTVLRAIRLGLVRLG
jgi:DNA-binding NarL/FixJ family response regulator